MGKRNNQTYIVNKTNAKKQTTSINIQLNECRITTVKINVV